MLPPVQAIVVYTDKEVHGAVGSQVTLYCSFWSSEWVSDDLSFTWRYQPEGGRDAISVSARGEYWDCVTDRGPQTTTGKRTWAKEGAILYEP